MQHAVHGHDILWRPAPVAADGEVAEAEHVLFACGHAAGARHDLLRHEPLGPQRAFVVEEDAGAGFYLVGLSILRDLPEGRRLGDAVGATGPQHGRLASRLFARVAKHLGAAGVVEADRPAEHADRLEQVYRADDDALKGFHRLVEREPHRGLAGEVVDLIRLRAGEHLHRGAKVDQRHRFHCHAVADAQPCEPVETAGLGVAAGADDRVAEVEQMRRQVAAVLTAHPTDEGLSCGRMLLNRQGGHRAVGHSNFQGGVGRAAWT